MQLQLVNVPVDGGDLRVLRWGTGKRVAVAVHGITASGMSWQAVARHMPADWTLAAPDLRGRGHSVLIGGKFRGTDLVYLSTEDDLGVIAEIVDSPSDADG